MKVCFVLHAAGNENYGAERSLFETIDALKKQGVECFVVLPGQGALISKLTSRGIPYFMIPYRSWLRRKNAPLWKRLGRTTLHLAMAVRVAVKIRQWQCDIVYTNTIFTCVGAFAAALLQQSHVWHIHEFGEEDHSPVFDLGQNFSLRLIDRLSSVCIANSKAVAQKYQQFITPSKLKVVYQAVSVAPDNLTVDVTPPAHFRCVIVGRLVEEKGQKDAIRALAELVHMGVRAELYIVGNGEPQYQQYLQAIVTENNIEKYITFVGYVENSFSFIQSADVILVCSRCEAFGRVTVEGMRAGKPVVGTRSGGTQELIQDGFNGLLYTVGDHKDLAQKVRYFYEHPAEAKKMGENGQQWAAKQFTQAVYGQEIYTLLRPLVKATSS
jgi:glycosyltransferase involved in cell wall biosynthesis